MPNGDRPYLGPALHTYGWAGWVPSTGSLRDAHVSRQPSGSRGAGDRGGWGLVGREGGGRVGTDPVRGGFQVERTANGRYQWQLKAPNGRIVAVSSPVYDSPQEADRVFAALRADAAELTARITHVRDGIGWIWVVPGSRGVPDARSNRAYERYATCQNSFRRFVALLERQAGESRERSPEPVLTEEAAVPAAPPVPAAPAAPEAPVPPLRSGGDA
ncbi:MULTISPECIES: DUF1508 domain-containing protein [unclassified Kitasatospora]|uniref:YegP family protein n=1 Tax=unclassified Kitasatospora TaxID=2633591 RepID=UPI0032AEBABF